MPAVTIGHGVAGQMQVNVAGLLKDRVGATRSYEIEEQALKSDGDTFESVHGPVRMLRTDRGILVRAQVSGDSHETCSRCLAPATVRVFTTVEEEFYPTNPFAGAKSAFELDAEGALDDSVFLIDDRNVLDIGDALRQALVSAIPMAPLCRPDCRGICPQCASDRNLDPCECSEPPAAIRRNLLSSHIS